MLFSLMKKDLILVKRYWALLIAFAIGAPVFVSLKAGIIGKGFLSFFLTVLFMEYVLFGTVSMIEDKYKGASLLCITPYTRGSLVEAKYLLIFAVYIFSYIIYSITALAAPGIVQNLSFLNVGISFLIITVFYAILIPAQYKFGFEKTKNIIIFVIFLFPIVFPAIIKWMNSNHINLQIEIQIPQSIQGLLLCLLALAIGVASMLLSIKIYSGKDL